MRDFLFISFFICDVIRSAYDITGSAYYVPAICVVRTVTPSSICVLRTKSKALFLDVYVLFVTLCEIN